MANEIDVNVAAKLVNGAFGDAVAGGNKKVTQAGNKIYRDVLSLTTSYAAAGKGSVGNLGFCFITADDGNSGNVIVCFDGGTVSVLTIAPGLCACLPLTPGFTISNMQLKMSTGTGAAGIQIWEA